MSNEIVYQTSPSFNSFEEQKGGMIPKIPPITSSIPPGTDFYAYVNQVWQSRVHLPGHEDTFGVSEEIEEDIQTILLKRLETERVTNARDSLSVLFSSFLHKSNAKQSASSRSELRKLLSLVDCVKTRQDLCRLVGTLNRIQSSAPICFVINNDSFDSSACSIYIYDASMGIPNEEVYSEDPAILANYKRLLRELGTHLSLENMESVAETEAALVPFLLKEREANDIHFVYNPKTYDELQEEFSELNWSAMLEAWGLTEQQMRTAKFIVTNKRFLHHFHSMVRTFDLTLLKPWLHSMILLSFLKYLPDPFDALEFSFFGHVLNGSKEKMPRSLAALKVLQKFADQDLSRVFVKHHVASDTKAKATELVRLLKHATDSRLRKLSWLHDSTRSAALKKLKAMSFQVAYPDHWRSETKGVVLEFETPLRNILRLAEHDTDVMMDQLRKAGCKEATNDWDDGAFEVNAYYYPEGNRIVVPAGILRFPFFDAKQSMAWNLGGIGVVIGHEITHGFDADGRLYDEKGNYNDWWLPEDSREFNKVSHSVVRLFDNAPYMGGSVNGDLTLSENLADLGGMAIALEALEAYLPADGPTRKRMMRDFFTSYAVSWRTKERKEKAKQSLSTDVHAPAPLRVNLVVRQFQAFYDAFDIGPDAEGYIPVEKRIVLW